MLPIKLVIKDTRDFRLIRTSLEHYCDFLDDMVLDNSVLTLVEIRDNQHLSDTDLKTFLNDRAKRTQENINTLIYTREMLHVLDNFNNVFPMIITANTQNELQALRVAIESYSYVVNSSVDDLKVIDFHNLANKSDDEITTILNHRTNKNSENLDDVIAIIELLRSVK